ncbi:ABC transporter permease [Rhodoferax sp.]|uniref:ABC transporter permease n=1 Tax=Rhodoferax sp. TaxID=50421 RepID=UPI0008AC405D|nr:ABC transporter permease [Rhodoferax sp.]MDO8320307.1 ABC transporter permease [Rhodoferax sp.]MDP2678212.1 ABC transporter permease [Rhodoferax sp.]OGB53066.1 MAG: glutathione ABC transporter permease GsiC [Burkholderiales bacterium RIFOXYD12_FULL_59_19]OGB80653.1 MAG: glutathione ABC transporter permease GsiC [Burkholderiales bacterium RIFOXYC12_FULL_60_6]
MMRYLLGRLSQAALLLLGVTLITFALLYILPADPARQIAGRSATAETVANIRTQLGLDLPFYQQYGRYVTQLVQGDLGRSYAQKTEVGEVVASRLPATLILMGAAIACELVIGLVIGIFAAAQQGRRSDDVVMMLSFVGVSTPQFVASLAMLYTFSVLLDWFPVGGYGEFKHVVLPAMTLGLLGAGWYARMLRSSMIDVLTQDYIRTARAKGASQLRVLMRHALRNAVLPVVAMIGIDIGLFMSGAVVVESVFGWPGIGQLAWQAIQQVDIPIIMGVTLVAAVAIVLGNLLADLVAPLIDPRIQLR